MFHVQSLIVIRPMITLTSMRKTYLKCSQIKRECIQSILLCTASPPFIRLIKAHTIRTYMKDLCETGSHQKRLRGIVIPHISEPTTAHKVQTGERRK